MLTLAKRSLDITPIWRGLLLFPEFLPTFHTSECLSAFTYQMPLKINHIHFFLSVTIEACHRYCSPWSRNIVARVVPMLQATVQIKFSVCLHVFAGAAALCRGSCMLIFDIWRWQGCSCCSGKEEAEVRRHAEPFWLCKQKGRKGSVSTERQRASEERKCTT